MKHRTSARDCGMMLTTEYHLENSLEDGLERAVVLGFMAAVCNRRYLARQVVKVDRLPD